MVLERARREPRTLAIGIDASAPAMADSSRRAARPVAKGGLPNAVFVVASAEHVPDELVGLADELTVLFPWGSLLRGTLGLGEAAARGIASLLRPGAAAVALVSVTDRDALGISPLDDESRPEIAARWSAFGLCVARFRRSTAEEAAATGSTWAKRLSMGRDRPLWRLEIQRPAADESVADAI